MNGLTANSDGQIIDLIERLTRAGYRVTFEPKWNQYGAIMPTCDIVFEGEDKKGLRATNHFDGFVMFHYDGPRNVPFILHPYGADAILKELERAANLLAPEAH